MLEESRSKAEGLAKIVAVEINSRRAKITSEANFEGTIRTFVANITIDRYKGLMTRLNPESGSLVGVYLPYEKNQRGIILKY